MAFNRLRNHTVVILDTNALFMPFQFKINLDSELIRLLGDYEIIVPSCVLSETRGLERSEKFGVPALKLALTKAPPKWYLDIELEIIETLKPIRDFTVDDQILEIAKAIDAIVVTNDKNFLKILKTHDISTISLRGRKYLKFN